MDENEPTSTNRVTVEQWTEALSRATGTPGGGAGSGVMLSVAAALISMVAGYGDASDTGGQRVEDIRSDAQTLRLEALDLADEDAACSRAFGQVFTLPHGLEREEAIRKAALEAAEASAAIGNKAASAVADLQWLASNGKTALIADTVVAAGALRAAVSGARANVLYDLATLESHRESSTWLQEESELHDSVARLDRALAQIDALVSEIDSRMKKSFPGS